MYDELTEVDLKKMREEIEYKTHFVRPKLVEDLQTARAFGDLSENYEYKTAKQELRKCDSRLRYLKRMISTARVVKVSSPAGVAGLFDKVTLYYEEDDEEETVELVTTLRQDSQRSYISKESPLGKAIMGRRVGERIGISPEKGEPYHVVIRAIEKGEDDESLPISSY